MHSVRAQYQHRPLSPAPLEPGKRLVDALHALRSMFESAVEENRQLRQLNGTSDAKVRRYLQELESVAAELRALEARHRRERDAYEAEVRRLREEIDAVRHPAPAPSTGPSQPSQRARSPSPPRDKPRSSHLRPATFTPEPGAAVPPP